MIRGTTAQFKFKMPYAKEDLAWVTIKFWQPGNTSRLLPIIKKLEHCDAPGDGTELYVSLTTEETSRFLDVYRARVQLRAQHSVSGTVFGSKTQFVAVYPMPDDILDEDPIVPPESEEGWIIFDGDPVSS